MHVWHAGVVYVKHDPHSFTPLHLIVCVHAHYRAAVVPLPDGVPPHVLPILHAVSPSSPHQLMYL